MSSKQRRTLLTSLIEFILKYLFGRSTSILDFLFDLFQRIPYFKSLPGMYEVLDYEAELELQDSQGRIAQYRKRQQVRFLQNNIIAFYDTAWGDGEIFGNYRCEPGVEVDRFRDGYRYRILISLREAKHQDDETTFTIERRICDGFTEHTELFQTEIDHRTRKFAFSVIFPRSRLPYKVSLIEQNRMRTTQLGTEHREVLADGRQRYTWKTQSPRLFESYIIQWEW